MREIEHAAREIEEHTSGHPDASFPLWPAPSASAPFASAPSVKERRFPNLADTPILTAAPSGLFHGALARETWPSPAILRLLGSLAILTLCSWLGIVLSHQSEGVATIWLSNGILFGLLITRPPRQWPAYFAIGLTADTLADVLFGDPFRLAAGVSVANSVEVITSSLLLTRVFGVPLNLARRRPLIGFLLIAVVAATGLCSILGASWTLLFLPAGPWWQLVRTWWLGDMLGMALLAPLVFMLQRPGFFTILRGRTLPHTLLVLLVAAASTTLVFLDSHDPLIFFLFPALLLVVFRLGFPGTVITIVLMACISIALTVSGHGPLMLIPGEHATLHRIVVAQVFLAVATFTMFPVAALLEERAELQHSHSESEARYRYLASADDLTGLSNRRAFNLRLEQEWHHATGAASPVALILLDADLFKTYNDLYGHLGGDECLRAIAATISETVSECAFRNGLSHHLLPTVARFGGEEFAVILPGQTATDAELLAEQIRSAVFARALPHEGSPSGIQTVSLGVASLVPEPGEAVMELVTVADRALYEAKHLGRNRVVTA